MHQLSNAFSRFAAKTAHFVGTPWAFVLALTIVVIWGLTGPIFHFSDTWQLVINTGTTIVTFLMVFVIQNTQNRDATALQLKVDEVIRAIKAADNLLVDVEEMSEEELQILVAKYRKVHDEAKRRTERKGPSIQ